MWEEECLRLGALLLLKGGWGAACVEWAEGGETELPWLLGVLVLVVIPSRDKLLGSLLWGLRPETAAVAAAALAAAAA